jgi:GNAT superfamily N-acetyltransferase
MQMRPDDDTTAEARALHRAHALIADLVPGGSASTPSRGISRVAIPVPMASMSGLFIDDETVDPQALQAGVDWFVGRGSPWSISVIGAVPPAVTELAAALHFVRRVEPTLVARIDGPRAVRRETGERFHRVETADDRRLWVETCDTAFGLPEGTSAALLTAEIVAESSIRAWYVERDGVPVATACSVLDPSGTVGLYSVATAEGSRRGGVGRRLVEFVLDDAAARGARTAYLQSSDMARPLYEQLGFQDAHQDISYFTPERPPVGVLSEG